MLLVLLALLFLPLPARALVITNNVTVSSSLGTVGAKNSVVAAVRTPSTVEFLQYGPGAPGAIPVYVLPTYYSSDGSPGGTFASICPITTWDGTGLPFYSSLDLLPAQAYKGGEPIFVRLTDLDQNRNALLNETVLVTLTSNDTGDSIVLRLSETGPDTGIFVGAVQSTTGPVAVNDCLLSVGVSEHLGVSYTDATDAMDRSRQEIMVDPYGLVFSTSDGSPVNGATVTLWNVNANGPAEVYHDDGSSGYPATVISGDPALGFPAGGFRFPFVRPGKYRLIVAPPGGFVAPSTVATSVIQELPGHPFALVLGSRGEDFPINPGPALRIDVPVDSRAGSLFISKKALKDHAAAGEYIQYSLTIGNTSNLNVTGLTVTDLLPPAFRYESGSTTSLDPSAPAAPVLLPDPQISADGRTLTFLPGALPAATSLELRYVVGVGAGAPAGIAINSASASGSAGGKTIRSNQAQASVRIDNDFFDDKALLMGRIYLGDCPSQFGQPAPAATKPMVLGSGSVGLRLTSKAEAAQGDYAAEIEVDKIDLADLVLVVELPELLTYRPGSARLDGKPQGDPEISNGSLRFTLGRAKAGQRSVLTFGVGTGQVIAGEHTTGAHLEFTNPDPQLTPGALLSTPAATNTLLEWSEDPAVSQLLVSQGDSGRIRLTTKGMVEAETADGAGLGRVRLFLEDGRYVDTDEKGLYHFEGLAPGSHVVQVDLDSLPEGVELLQCEDNTRFAGVAHSQFLDLQPGTMWRADFYARAKKPAAKPGVVELSTTLIGAGPEVNLALKLSGGGKVMRERRLYVDVPEGLRYLPGTARFDGRPLADPESGGEGLVFSLGDRDPAPWRQELTFHALITDGRQVRDYTSRAFMRYLTPEPVEGLGQAQKGGEQEHLPLSAGPDATSPLVGEAAPLPQPVTEKAAPAALPDGLLSIKEGQRLGMRTQAIPVCLDNSLKPELLVDGKPVDPKRIGMQMNEEGSNRIIYSYIGVDLGEPGPHLLSFRGLDGFGNARFKQEVNYILTSPVASIRVLETNGNLADGKTPVRVRLELRDAAHELISGETTLSVTGGDLRPWQESTALPELRENTGAVTVDSQGYLKFAPVSASGTHTATLSYGDLVTEIRTYVKPQFRQWIMVGLAEGTAGYDTISGNLENLTDPEQEEGFFLDGRLAFYAKGMVKGQYLLTAAYDSARERSAEDNGLFGTIDPNKYYAIYGDQSQVAYDAASKDKLFLKLDGDQFYALYGDYQTGLTVTELSRYSRSLTGLKAEYHGERLEGTAFAAETDHAFIKDELPGDGTSGLYRLSHQAILLNSEKISIETRDRFHSELVLTRRQLSRYLDYTFDPQDGTIYFREPIYSRNGEFNPINIVAEYEVATGAAREVSGGGRVGYRVGEKGPVVGLSVIHEGTPGARADLQGIDVTYEPDDQTTIKVEAATSTKTSNGNNLSGNAFLAEVGRHGQQLDGKAYYRQEDSDFGLGQQAGSESGTRKYGADGRYTITQQLGLSGEMFRQEGLGMSTSREVIAAALHYKLNELLASGGLRFARDEEGAGAVRQSTLLTGALERSLLADRLKLSANAELAVGQDASGDYPNRLILGGEYAITGTTSLFAAHEMTYGENQDSQSSRVGIKATPWREGAVHSSIEQQSGEYGPRTFASMGLTQGLKLSDRLALDFGLERTETLQHPGDTPLNANVPPASGAITDDFTAVSAGATYKEKLWSMTGRGEYRDGEQEDKAGVLWGFYREETPGFGLASVFRFFDADRVNGSHNTKSELEFSVARRPLDSQWQILDKATFAELRDRGPAVSCRTRKLVNNLNANYLHDRRNQVSLNHGIKYVIDNFDGVEYDGISQFLAVEYRHDLNAEWDLGLHGAAHVTNVGDNARYSSGVSVGHSFARNVWLSVGYNFDGFRDDDFSGANYTAQGVYLKCRAKFDQNTARQLLAWWEK
jgi:uncharacterized repeat protein (TIGR01451 family)